MKYIIGRKLDMTQVWQGDKQVAVTRIKLSPNVAIQVKDGGKDGYKAVAVGFGERKAKNIKKPQIGHFKSLGNFQAVRELRDIEGATVGFSVDPASFAAGETVDAIGTSKGKGFQGVVRRHGFKGSKKTHGNKDQLRMSGSIGAGGLQHVQKGRRMGGHMGAGRVTTKNTTIVAMDLDNGLILVGGSVPGARNGLVMLRGEGEMKWVDPKAKVEADEKPVEEAETVVEEKNEEAPE
jgi:large subunit ribosomal protein L3